MSEGLTLLIEEDYAENNFSIYVPELRLSAVGDTEEEALLCAQELIEIFLANNPSLNLYATKVMRTEIPKFTNFSISSAI
ncbi:type II toxin-antitoxin system HicB family antitoxin [Paenibacillus sp. FSL K6-2859]|uniref:type II toxin-antitoxin system HicB family antitoxin n=1 Tax=Paenibacillus sp. FSL K6-2859 TaxID=2921482 RepID=UPI0030FBF18D